MNDLELLYDADYKIDSNAAIIYISKDAEENRSPILESNDRVTVTNGDKFLEGLGTAFTSYIKAGDKVRPQSTDDWYQVLEVENEKITLTKPYTGVSYSANEPLQEVTSISGLSSYKAKYKFKCSNASHVMSGKYFKIWDSQGSVGVWFDINNVGTLAPTATNLDRLIEVTSIHDGDTNFTVLNRIAQKLNLDDEFVCTVINDELFIENKTTGVRPVAVDSDIFNVFAVAYNKQRVICAADVGDSLDQKYFTLRDGSGSIAFWIAVDNNIGAIEPSHGANRSVKITTINTNDSAGTVRNKVKAYVIADGFSCVDVNTNTFIATRTMESASSGTMPSGFVLSTENTGKSAYELQDKHFIIPYHNSGTDKTAAFWFNVDNASGSAPSIIADDIIDVDLEAQFNEAEIFEAIAVTIDAHIAVNAEYTESSCLITSVAFESVTTVLSNANSGLVISQVQAGSAANPIAGKILQYKNFTFGEQDVLSCDVYGKTVNGLSSGDLIKTAPEVVKDLISHAGFKSIIDSDSFDLAKELFSERISLCVPQKFNDKTNMTYRDVINKVNNSVFGVLIQSNDFKLQYESLRPRCTATMLYLNENDILDYKISSTNKNILSKSIAEYGFNEYNYLTKNERVDTASKESKTAKFLLDVSNSKNFESVLVDEKDAVTLASRWSFLLEYSSNTLEIETKLITSELKINDIIIVDHKKIYDRLGGEGSLKMLLVEAVSKNAYSVTIQAIDLSNAFNRVAKISNTSTNYSNSNDETRLQSGYYTDDNGVLIDDNSTNKIW